MQGVSVLTVVVVGVGGVVAAAVGWKKLEEIYVSAMEKRES